MNNPIFNILKPLVFAIVVALFASLLSGCIEDGYASSPSDQPEFSTDTLLIEDLFTAEPTTTHRFMVYNRHDRILNLSRVEFRNPSQRVFRVNVDGRSGASFDNVEIRPNDSIFVFVEATVDPTGGWDPVAVEELLDFTVNGVRSSVVLAASGNNVERLHGVTVERDTLWTGDHLRQVFDSLIVAPGVRLTIGEGARIFFHDAAFVRVDGTLVVEGTAKNPVDFCGDRRGNVAADIPFDLMASQWVGLEFSPLSRDSRMTHATVRNTVAGVRVDSLAGSGSPAPALELVNCRLRNSAGYALEVEHADLRAVGCELADASMGVVRLTGGNHEIAYCTIANYYLFTALGGPALQLHHLGAKEEEIVSEEPLMSARITNTIVYGNGSDLNHGDLVGTDVIFNRCLLRSEGSDDDNFINCLWGEDPLYYTDRPEYIFDYRLREESLAIGASDPALTPAAPATDPFGTLRPAPASIGAYEPKAQ